MPVIRIPEKDWGKVWRFLLDAGPISRISQEKVYLISDRQLQLLKKKKMPFELVDAMNGPPTPKKQQDGKTRPAL